MYFMRHEPGTEHDPRSLAPFWRQVSGMPDQALAWMLRMNLWHIWADSEASLEASMAAARLSVVLVLQPSTDSCADATACRHRAHLGAYHAPA